MKAFLTIATASAIAASTAMAYGQPVPVKDDCHHLTNPKNCKTYDTVDELMADKGYVKLKNGKYMSKADMAKHDTAPKVVKVRYAK